MGVGTVGRRGACLVGVERARLPHDTLIVRIAEQDHQSCEQIFIARRCCAVLRAFQIARSITCHTTRLVRHLIRGIACPLHSLNSAHYAGIVVAYHEQHIERADVQQRERHLVGRRERGADGRD